MLSFTALDFETANSSRASVCQVGLTRVENGRVVEVDEWLVVPPTGLDSFQAMNVSIHGITPDRAAGGLSWGRSMERLARKSGGDALVAFNAPFDRSVFDQASAMAGVEMAGEVRWECALSLSRRHLTLPRYRLGEVTRHLGVDLRHHHAAGADALAAAEVVLRIAERAGLPTVDALWPGAASGGSTRRKASGGQAKAGEPARNADLPRPNPHANPLHPLFAHRVVVTGDVEGLDRGEVLRRIAHAGGVVQKNVTKKTSVLVLADLFRVHPGHDLSRGTAKERKAQEYLEDGQRILLLSGPDLLRYLAL